MATLAALLPASVRERIEPELLTEPPTAAALRVLATIRDPRWHEHVRGARIYWADLIAWTRAECAVDSPVRVRVEIAASLAGYADARPDLFRSARVLDRENCAAVLDAMRIARTGVVR